MRGKLKRFGSRIEREGENEWECDSFLVAFQRVSLKIRGRKRERQIASRVN